MIYEVVSPIKVATIIILNCVYILGWRIFWTRYLERTGIHIRRAAAAAEDEEAKAGTNGIWV